MSGRHQKALFSTTALAGLLGMAVSLAPVHEARADCTPGATAGDDTITCTGTSTGDLDTLAGDDAVTNSGSITGDVDLGVGSNFFEMSGAGSVTGTVTDGGFLGQFNVSTNADFLYDFAKYIDFFDVVQTGPGTLTLTGTGGLMGVQAVGDLTLTNADLTADTIIMNGGTLAVEATSTLNANGAGLDFIGGGSTFLNDGVASGDVFFQGVFNTFFNTGTYTATVIRFIGDDGWLDNTGTISGDISFEGLFGVLFNDDQITGDIVFVGDEGWLDNTGTITGDISFGGLDSVMFNDSLITGNIVFAAGDDLFFNSGTIDGNIALGAGDDLLDLYGAWSITGTVDAGLGFDELTINNIASVSLGVTDFSGYSNFESFEKTGIGLFEATGLAGLTTLTASGGTLDISLSDLTGTAVTVNGSTLILYQSNADNLQGGALSDTLQLIDNIVTGPVDMGEGDNVFSLEGTATLNGNLLFGSGDDIATLSGGTLNGDLTLGGGANSIVIDLDAGATLASITGTIDGSGSTGDTIEYFGSGVQTITLADVAGIETIFIHAPNRDTDFIINDSGVGITTPVLMEALGWISENIAVNVDIDVGTNPAGALTLHGASDAVEIVLWGDIVGTVGYDSTVTTELNNAALIRLLGSITTDGVNAIDFGESLAKRYFENPGTISVSNAVGILASAGIPGPGEELVESRISNRGSITVTGATDSHGIQITGPDFYVLNGPIGGGSGTITVTSDSGHGIFVQSGSNRVDNYALIETFTLTGAGVADGIRIDGGGDILKFNAITNHSTGVIRTNGDNSAGIRYLGTAGDNQITNNGLIETLGANADGVAIQISAFEVNDNYDPPLTLGFASFGNGGIIRVTGAGSVGIRFEVPATEESTRLDIQHSQMVNGGLIESAGVAILGGVGHEWLKNDGIIIGSIDLLSGNDRLENFGDIIGDINLGVGDDALENSGTITGNIVFGGSGTFINTGDILGSVDLGTATMTGDGQITGGLTNGGSLDISLSAVPDPITTLTVGGSYTQLASGSLDVDIAGLQTDLLQIGGTATLDGAVDVTFVFDQNEFIPGQSFEFLTASGGVTGTFSSVVANTTPFLDATVIYSANSVSVRLDRSSFLLPILDAYQRSVAVAVDAMAAAGVTAQAGEIIEILTFSQVPEAMSIFDQLATGAAAEVTTPIIDARHGFLSHLSGRAGDLAGLRGIEGRWVTDIAGYGAFGNAAGNRYSSGGAVAISAYGINDRLTVGFAVGGTASDLRLEQQYGENGHTALDVAGFAGYRVGLLSVTTVLGVSYDALDTERSVLTTGFEGTSTGGASGVGYSAAVDARYDLSFAGFNLVPEASFRLASFHHGDYEEEGLGNLGLRFGSRTVTSARASSGLSLKKTFRSFSGFEVTPEVGAFYEREVGERDRSVMASFIAAPETSFLIQGIAADRSRTRLTGGLTARFSDSLSAAFRYEGALGAIHTTHQVTGGLRLSW